MDLRRDLASRNQSVLLLSWGKADRYTRHCPVVLRMVVPGKGFVMELWASWSQRVVISTLGDSTHSQHTDCVGP